MPHASVPVLGTAALVFTALAAPVRAQAQSAEAVAPLVAFLNANGKTALVTSTITIKREQSLTPLRACEAILHDRSESDAITRVFDRTLRFGELSPAVAVQPLTGTDAYVVRVVTTSGAQSIASRRTSDRERSKVPVDGATDFVEFVLGDRLSADTASAALTRTISACGGAPRTAAAEALGAAAARESEAAMYGGLALEERTRLLSVCRARIGALLKAPSTARFDASREPLITKVDGGEVTVFGHVEAQNSYGGMLEKAYLCTFEPYGKQYVPKLTSIL